jgi:hypothetical protein
MTPIPTGTPAATTAGPEAGQLWGGLVVDRRGHVAVAARLGAAGEWVELPDHNPVPTGRWVHYAGVIRYAEGASPALRLYRDGVEVAYGDGETPDRDPLDMRPVACHSDSGDVPGDGGEVYVGGLCAAAPQYVFRGRIDEVRIWERALEAGEVQRWRVRPGEFYDEAAYWPLDDGPGRRIAGRGCTLDQSCNRAGDGYPLWVSGPAWVEAEPAWAAAGGSE